MPTLLDIYESYHNGQGKQFAEQVTAYGAAEFARDTAPEISEGILSTGEALAMLRSYIIITNA